TSRSTVAGHHEWATVSRPVGGVLCSLRSGGHPSKRPTKGIGRAALPLFGLAPSGVCRATRVTPGAGALLPHRFTLTCARRPSAVCSLWHFPAGHPDWPLASTLPCGAPTFLDAVRNAHAATTRPTHRRPPFSRTGAGGSASCTWSELAA